MPKVLIVIPTYNERGNIESLIEALTTSHFTFEFHIMVVDDNSPDGTAEIVERISRNTPHVHLLRRPSKMGLGSAYKEAFIRSIDSVEPDVVVQMDADFSHPPDALQVITQPILDNECEVSVGSRYVKGGGSKNWTWKRRVISKGANYLARLLARTGVKDSTSGFRGLSKVAVESIISSKLSGSGYEYQIESLCIFRKHKLTVKEIPYAFRERRLGETKLSLKDILSFLKLIFVLAFRR